MKIYWVTLTRYCDWYQSKRDVPKEMIYKIEEANLIGKKKWIRKGVDNYKDLPYKMGMLEDYLNHQNKKEETFLLTVGGETPISWELSLGMFPYIKEKEQVRGFNTLQVSFETPKNIEALIATFKTVNQGNKTEFASIHPYERWEDLSDTLFGEYGEPITFKPALSGVFWVTIIGPGHLQLFDIEKLKKIKAYEIEWLNNETLFIRVCEHINDVIQPKMEQEMFRITEELKKALKSNQM